ncbi:aspartate/glutamate racemase family protein [Sphingobium sp. JS3065]|uniref:aspartate/glutamate racemase family protein n=1 Tax=Sphingobium sp. JS3065 TaxID=2970925 RepID=UPI002263D7CF|nr:aspartate/glutamate racemase family protein [Sphingobium sp. JS3065]UZW56444.1 aspartate/glutamate racemase family protein [Sphingobium sp. JS3065]
MVVEGVRAGRDEEVRILWISDTTPQQMAKNPDDQALVYENMLEYVRSVARSNTKVDIHFVKDNAGEAFSPWLRYPRALLAVEVIERVRQADRDGYDAAFPGMCFGEFFLEEARQAVTMPVVGAAESSMMVAQLLGKKFAVVTTFQRFERPIEDRLRAHRWESRAIGNRPIRSYTPDLSQQMVDAYKGRPERMIEEFDQHAQQCVKEGADVVICGCNPLGAALSKAGYKEVAGTGVPVVTALSSMIKQAEMLVDLKRSLGMAKSEALVGPYMTTPQAVLEDLEARGIGMKPSYSNAEPAYSSWTP